MRVAQACSLHRRSIGTRLPQSSGADRRRQRKSIPGGEPGEHARIRGAGWPHPIAVEAVSLPGLVSTVSSAAQAILLLTDPEEDIAPDVKRIGAALGLTPAEAMFCREFARGSSVSEAAEALSISEGTARQRLKHMFQKTNTHRRGQLMLLLSRL